MDDFPFESTASVPIPKDPLKQIIGQMQAVKLATIAARQHRNLLLVGPPGIGKSLLAQALSHHLPEPTEEVSVLHNPETPEKPLVEIVNQEQLAKEKRMNAQIQGKLVGPKEVPSFVAERLGFRCRRCGKLSDANDRACPGCGLDKYAASFGNTILSEYLQEANPQARVHTTRLMDDGR